MALTHLIFLVAAVGVAAQSTICPSGYPSDGPAIDVLRGHHLKVSELQWARRRGRIFEIAVPPRHIRCFELCAARCELIETIVMRCCEGCAVLGTKHILEYME